jgi:hypothetical protein
MMTTPPEEDANAIFVGIFMVFFVVSLSRFLHNGKTHMYTVEVYKLDKRTKSGERLVFKHDYNEDLDVVNDMLEHGWRYPTLSKVSGLYPHVRRSAKCLTRYEVRETYVTRKNLLSGVEYKERYDAPVYCSPSSESYWSM